MIAEVWVGRRVRRGAPALAFIVLLMAGRSISGDSAGHAQFIGDLGPQVLLSDYGRTLMRQP